MTTPWPARRSFMARACAGLGASASGRPLGLASGLLTCATALAQGAPQPLRLLCSGPAGSIPDTVARRVAEQLASGQARQVLVDNRPGAAGQLSVAALKTAAADGSTMLLAQGAIATVYPYLYPRSPMTPRPT